MHSSTSSPVSFASLSPACVARWCTSLWTVLLSSAHPPTARPTTLPMPLSACATPSLPRNPSRSSIPLAFTALSAAVVAALASAGEAPAPHALALFFHLEP